MDKEKKRDLIERGKVLLFFAIVGLALFLFVYRGWISWINIESIKWKVKSAGFWGWFLFVFLLALTSAITSQSIIFFNIGAALLFDTVPAILLLAIGLTLGAISTFIVSRYLARRFVQEKIVNRFKSARKIENFVTEKGYKGVFVITLNLLTPFALSNAIFGLSRIKFKEFLFGFLLGMFPGVIVTVLFYQSFADVRSIRFMLLASLMVLFVTYPVLEYSLRKTYEEYRKIKN